MALALPWMIPVLLGVLVLAVVVTLVSLSRRSRRPSSDALAVAHSARIAGLPSYRRVVARFRWVVAGVLLVVVAGAAGAGVLAARPISVSVAHPEQFNRDVVLCLDVSGSMIDYDAEVIRRFEQIVEQFEGERIGLVLWDSSAVQVFPLTDDYDVVEERLKLIRGSFDFDAEREGHDDEFWAGTQLGDGASLVGDGLASCVLGFDHDDQERSRSVVLSTDNLENGQSLVSLEEASEFASARGVKVYSLTPVFSYSEAEAEQLKVATESTGGVFLVLDDAESVTAIVDGVLSEEAAGLEGAARLIYSDAPAVPIALAFVSLALLLLLVWRVRL